MRSDPVELAVSLAEHLTRGVSRWFGLSPLIGLERER
jgi:hypothetical protein